MTARLESAIETVTTRGTFLHRIAIETRIVASRSVAGGPTNLLVDPECGSSGFGVRSATAHSLLRGSKIKAYVLEKAKSRSGYRTDARVKLKRTGLASSPSGTTERFDATYAARVRSHPGDQRGTIRAIIGREVQGTRTQSGDLKIRFVRGSAWMGYPLPR